MVSYGNSRGEAIVSPVGATPPLVLEGWIAVIEIPIVLVVGIALLSFASGYGARALLSLRRRLRYRY